MQDLKLAILIDADNISPKYVKVILDEAASFGVAACKRIYGDWSDVRLKSWKDALLNNSIIPIQQYSYTTGKNATDSAMIIDAMDLLYSGNLDGFCIVSSDSDFTRLAARLREAGKLVIGMGESKALGPFVKACDQFKYLDLILDHGEADSAPAVPAAEAGARAAAGDDTAINRESIGRIIDGIHKAGVSNPVMVLDEVDKLSASYNGDPASALLEVLDPEQNKTFVDHYLNVPFDLSDVFFVCTANTTDTIPAPLLNRMEVINFNGYTANDKLAIAKEHLLAASYAQNGVPDNTLIIPDDTLRTLIDDYTMESGVRGLRKRIDTLCRQAAVKLAKGEEPPFTVTPDDLRTWLDMQPILHDHILSEKKPGVVTGLAWTQAGGEILFIEALFTQGSGKLLLTGKLGDVMKESAYLATSLVKAMFPDEWAKYEKSDLHIHVPEGAVPKDGPSAGITLTTAIASLVTGRAVAPSCAMTGEVSLRGAVTAIGGLPEKLMAAQRAGITTVFIPQENERDLADIDDDIKKGLDIVPVSDVRDVLEQVGILQETNQA